MERKLDQPNHPESRHLPERPSHEAAAETLPARHEKVDESQERERQAENLDRARVEAQAEAKLASEVSSHQTEKDKAAAPHRSTQKKTLYRQTLKATQAQLPRSSRIFSRLIHARGVEVTSDVLARTVLRPLPLLSAGIVAFAFTTLIYIIGRYQGYGLVGGGWWLVSLAAGYSLGLFYDLTRVLWQRRQH